MARLKVLVVDDHEVVRVGLTSLIGRHEGFEVVAQAATGTEAVEQAIRHQPDLVVLDVLLPDKSGIEACREIRAACPNSRVLMLTSHANDEAVFQAIMAGASGYILKQVGSNPLIDALKAVAGGRLTPGPRCNHAGPGSDASDGAAEQSVSRLAERTGEEDPQSDRRR